MSSGNSLKEKLLARIPVIVSVIYVYRARRSTNQFIRVANIEGSFEIIVIDNLRINVNPGDVIQLRGYRVHSYRHVLLVGISRNTGGRNCIRKLEENGIVNVRLNPDLSASQRFNPCIRCGFDESLNNNTGRDQHHMHIFYVVPGIFNPPVPFPIVPGPSYQIAGPSFGAQLPPAPSNHQTRRPSIRERLPDLGDYQIPGPSFRQQPPGIGMSDTEPDDTEPTTGPANERDTD